jgi:phthalate 4,5-cis-dihydrodiol dehydrogenase
VTTTESSGGSGSATAKRTLKIGMIGIGVGGAEMLPAMEAMEEIDLFAGADVVPTTRERFKERYPEARVYDSAEAMCKDPDLEAVWISSPNRFHAEHTILAANHGKHVVVEKPMAISIEEAEKMCEAAERNGVKLLAGHTRSFTLPVRAMRRVVQSGKLGDLKYIQLTAYSDWMLRPRTADELDITQGGGIPFRQGPHQIDTVRVLGGGMLRSVRGMTGDWFKAMRPIPGFYTAYLEFENGLPAQITHNGYGYFMGGELVPWGTTKQRYTAEERVKIRKQMREGTRDEAADKQDLRIGGEMEREVFRAREPEPWIPEDMGILFATCERGDIRHSKYGIYVYDDEGQHDINTTPERAMGVAGRRAELEELYDAVVLGKPLWHDGRWGMATLEVCLAVMESAKRREEIKLSHQIPLPADYDSDFELAGY